MKWFDFTRSTGRSADDTIRITFTGKPKGIRINAAFARMLSEMKVQFVQVGLDDQRLVIKPADEGFKLVQGKTPSAQISSTPIGLFAQDAGLTKQRVEGFYDEKNNLFVFDLSEHMSKDVAAAGEE